MSHSAFYRTSGIAGLCCAGLLVINAARRASLLPENAVTHAVAPLASLAGLFVLTGLYVWQRDRLGTTGLLGYALNAAGLAGVFAIEYTVHFTFANLDDDVVEHLVAGSTGTAFTVTSVVFVLGVAIFGTAAWRARVLPQPAVALYVVGLIPVGLRTLMPLPIYLSGLALAAIGVAWLSVALYREATEETPRPRLATS